MAPPPKLKRTGTGTPRSLSVYERFLRFISPEPNSGCHLWLGCLADGYGTFRNGKMVKAHRFSYEHYKGKIPDGMELDHLCRVRCCVNPDHLEVVTHKENFRRGNGPSIIEKYLDMKVAVAASIASRLAKTHCRKGHSFADAYIVSTPTGTSRRCRICALELNQRWAARRKAMHAPQKKEPNA